MERHLIHLKFLATLIRKFSISCLSEAWPLGIGGIEQFQLHSAKKIGTWLGSLFLTQVGKGVNHVCEHRDLSPQLAQPLSASWPLEAIRRDRKQWELWPVITEKWARTRVFSRRNLWISVSNKNKSICLPSSNKHAWSTYYILLLLLLLLSRFSRVRLCATPQTAAHQAPPSLGFSRQKHWSGLPFPSPMHESEKWKCSRSVVSDF